MIRCFLEGKPGTVLMPAYHHGVEVEAVRAAGARIAFYRVDDSMRIDVEDIARRAKDRSVRVVYVTSTAPASVSPANSNRTDTGSVAVPHVSTGSLEKSAGFARGYGAPGPAGHTQPRRNDSG